MEVSKVFSLSQKFWISWWHAVGRVFFIHYIELTFFSIVLLKFSSLFFFFFSSSPFLALLLVRYCTYWYWYSNFLTPSQLYMSLSYCATFSNIILPLSSKCSIKIKNLWISKIFYHFLKLCWHFLSIVISFCVLFIFVDLYLLNFLIVTLVGVCRRRILGSSTGGDRNAVEVSVLGLPGGFVSILLLIRLSHVIWVPSLPSPSSWLLIMV